MLQVLYTYKLRKVKLGVSRERVFFASAKTEGGKGILPRITASLEGLQERIKIHPGDKVAIKVHMGEAGHTRYIRPIFVREIVEFVKRAGGYPFVTDTTTLYRQARHNLFDYLETARRNGFTYETMNCPVIISDFFKNSGVEVQVENPLKLNKVKVAQGIYDADCLIAVSHVTFHPFVVPAASIKNVAMGCTTKETKLQMHVQDAKPKFVPKKCIKCWVCLNICSGGAFYKVNGEVRFDPARCVGCGICFGECQGGAVEVPWDSLKPLDVQKGVIDAFIGVMSTFKENKAVFINYALDITELCDCISRADIPVLPDLGAFASGDAAACDKATFDAMETLAPYPSSKLANAGSGVDRSSFLSLGASADGFFEMVKAQHAGTPNYELIQVA
jgi:hypothetical protein